MRQLDLFSGIGMFAYAMQRVWGKQHSIAAFCEIEQNCQSILKKHWPYIPIYSDIRNLKGSEFAKIDIITGGFPCQDISACNHSGQGLRGKRSGLWWEFRRIISEIGPKHVIVENSAELLYRGAGDLFASMAEIGYNTQWHCIPGYYVGAPHERDRIWIIANTNGARWHKLLYNYLQRELKKEETKQNIALAKCNNFVDEFEKSVGESPVFRMDNGHPTRLDTIRRLQAVGNAIIPWAAVMILRGIKEVESAF
jgi:DNA (cytosine-5)-methyltransferase 1